MGLKIVATLSLFTSFAIWAECGLLRCPPCKPHESNTIRPEVKWAGNNQCYRVYDQGPCPEGQWLVPNKVHNEYQQRKGICSRRFCPENSVKNSGFWFEYFGSCIQTETTSPKFCGNENQIVYYSLLKLGPVCTDERPVIVTVLHRKINERRRVTRKTRGRSREGCPDGFKKLRNGDCRPIADSFENDTNSSDDSDDDSSDEVHIYKKKDKGDDSDEAHEGVLGHERHKGALGYSPHKGALGYSPHKGALGYSPHKGALGYSPHKGALGYGPYEGAAGYGPYGPYEGATGSG